MSGKGFSPSRWTAEQSAAFGSDGIKQAKMRRFLRQKQEVRTEEVAAMLFCGDEPTGDVKAMTLIDLFTQNKAYRRAFFDAPEGERMYEWRFKSKATKANGDRNARNSTSFKAAIIRNPRPSK